MAKQVKDTTLSEILNNGISIEDGELYHQDIILHDIYRCELCNSHFKSRMDVLEHIINCHMDDELNIWYLTGSQFKREILDKQEQNLTEVIIDPYELEIH